MVEILQVAMRWVHLASVAVLVGGIVYAKSTGATRDEQLTRFRGFALAAMAGLILSGLYSLLGGVARSPQYHMGFGIKILLALHVFAVTLVAAKPGNPKRERLLTGAMISGLIIILLAAYLRRL